MKVYDETLGIWLINVSDIEQFQFDKRIKENYIYLERIKDWINNFLNKNHPNLGRKGNVCPYTLPSVKKNLFWLTVHRSEKITIQSLVKIITQYCDLFKELEPKTKNDFIYKTILIILPDISISEALNVVEKAQLKLKYDSMREGLMIGQFHPVCQDQGVRNINFRPLQSPIPLIAIRNMIPQDLLFIQNDKKAINSFNSFF